MIEVLSKTEPIVTYDPASMGGDMSIIMVAEKQTITKTFDFGETPVSYPKYRVLFSKDVKNMDYTRQVVELAAIIGKTRSIYDRDPAVAIDATGNEGLADILREAVKDIQLCKFAADMDRQKGHAGRFITLNKPVWVQKLALLLETEQIIIDAEMSGAKEIKKQLEQFSARVRTSGSVAYEAKAGHDDYVTCLLLTIAARAGPAAFACRPLIPSASHYTGAQPGYPQHY